MKRSFISLALAAFTLSGCSGIMNWFNSVGDHMPVIGDRCENWQCFTSSGQQMSDQKKAQTATAKRQQVNGGTDQSPPPSPAPQAAAPETPPPPANPSPAEERNPAGWQPAAAQPSSN